MSVSDQEVLDFWFKEIDVKQQFAKDLAFDEVIRQRFSAVFDRVCRGETASWRVTPDGRLAEIIVLDQFSRNMFRDTARAFATDELALKLALEAIEVGADRELPPNQQAFMYMPLMHSEDPGVHEKAVMLFSQKGLENNYKFELLHKKIIDQFGRYPHRNEILGRESTPEEIEFMKTHAGF